VGSAKAWPISDRWLLGLWVFGSLGLWVFGYLVFLLSRQALSYSSGMIQRYSRAAMRDIWSEQRKLDLWLQIELLTSEALVKERLVPKKDFQIMRSRAAFSVERCK